MGKNRNKRNKNKGGKGEGDMKENPAPEVVNVVESHLGGGDCDMKEKQAAEAVNVVQSHLGGGDCDMKKKSATEVLNVVGSHLGGGDCDMKKKPATEFLNVVESQLGAGCSDMKKKPTREVANVVGSHLGGGDCDMKDKPAPEVVNVVQSHLGADDTQTTEQNDQGFLEMQNLLEKLCNEQVTKLLAELEKGLVLDNKKGWIQLLDSECAGLESVEMDPSKELLLQLKSKLASNIHYFVNWHCNDGSNKNLETASKEFVKELLESLLRFTTVGRGKKQLEEMKFTESSGLQDLVGFFVEAFIRIASKVGLTKQRKWNTVAALCLRGVNQFANKSVEEELLHRDYLPAIKYLEKWVKLQISLAKGKIPKDFKDLEAYDWEQEFQGMPDKSKSLVYATKATFIGNFRRISLDSQKAATVALRQAIALDPKVYEFHYMFQNWLRYSRRQNRQDGYFCPSEEEIKTIWETFEVCVYTKTELVEGETKDSKLRKCALAGVCQGVAELLAFKMKDRATEYPVAFGGLNFQNEKEMVDFVYKNTKNILEDVEESSHSFSEWIRTGEILSSILPWKYRDIKTAEICYKKALELLPENSKVNHKLGGLYLVKEEGHPRMNTNEALGYFRKAVSSEPNNIPASMDLLKTLLNAPAENKEEFEMRIKSILELPQLMANDLVQLKFVEGCFKFMLGEQKAAVKIWVENPIGQNIFSYITTTSRRHRWNARLLDFKRINEVLQNFKRSREATEKDKEAINKLGASTHNFQKNYNNRQYGRGAGGYNKPQDDWRKGFTPLLDIGKWTATIEPESVQKNDKDNNEQQSEFPPGIKVFTLKNIKRVTTPIAPVNDNNRQNGRGPGGQNKQQGDLRKGASPRPNIEKGATSMAPVNDNNRQNGRGPGGQNKQQGDLRKGASPRPNIEKGATSIAPVNVQKNLKNDNNRQNGRGASGQNKQQGDLRKGTSPRPNIEKGATSMEPVGDWRKMTSMPLNRVTGTTSMVPDKPKEEEKKGSPPEKSTFDPVAP